MAKTQKWSYVICLPVFLLLASILYLLFYLIGFVFVSQSINLVTIFIVIALTVIDLINRKNERKSFQNKLYFNTPPIAFGFIIIRLLATATHTITFNIMVIITLACSLIVFFYCVQKSTRKAVHGAIYSVFVAIVFLIASLGVLLHFVWMPSGGVEVDRISEMSPNGTHIVDVIHRSEGALGGSTTVTVQRAFRVNLLLGELQYRSEQVHRGGWGEFFDIENVRWDGENRFYIYRSDYRSGEINAIDAFELSGSRWRMAN